MSEIGFSGTKAASVVGISYRQLDYWARTDLVRPSLVDATRQRQPAHCTATATCSNCE
jgi:hypothetical protein